MVICSAGERHVLVKDVEPTFSLPWLKAAGDSVELCLPSFSPDTWFPKTFLFIIPLKVRERLCFLPVGRVDTGDPEDSCLLNWRMSFFFLADSGMLLTWSKRSRRASCVCWSPPLELSSTHAGLLLGTSAPLRWGLHTARSMSSFDFDPMKWSLASSLT